MQANAQLKHLRIYLYDKPLELLLVLHTRMRTLTPPSPSSSLLKDSMKYRDPLVWLFFCILVEFVMGGLLSLDMRIVGVWADI
jgi:hypothetical protein